jgi:hypothetical protein
MALKRQTRFPATAKGPLGSPFRHCPPFELHTVIEPLAANHQDRSTFKAERRAFPRAWNMTGDQPRAFNGGNKTNQDC